jgi:hypothetical protein
VALRLDPTTEDLAQTRNALLNILAIESDPEEAQELAETVARLGPTVGELVGPDRPQVPLYPQLAAARRNSRLPDWLMALPMLR